MKSNIQSNRNLQKSPYGNKFRKRKKTSISPKGNQSYKEASPELLDSIRRESEAENRRMTIMKILAIAAVFVVLAILAFIMIG